MDIEKVKLTDVGETSDYCQDVCCRPIKNQEKRYPDLYLDSEQLPDLSDFEAGQEITLVIKATVTSKTIRQDEEKEEEDFRIELNKIGVVGKPTKTKYQIKKVMPKKVSPAKQKIQMVKAAKTEKMLMGSKKMIDGMGKKAMSVVKKVTKTVKTPKVRIAKTTYSNSKKK
jgi:hypothetical protein